MFVKTVNEMHSVVTKFTFALSKSLPSKGSNSVYIAHRVMPLTQLMQSVAVYVYTNAQCVISNIPNAMHKG